MVVRTFLYRPQPSTVMEHPPLRLYNTLTRSKEPFTPMNGKEVRLYTCGPTVYNYAHIGNLRTYIFEDILKRILLYNELKVLHVMNITDVGHLTGDNEGDADSGEDKMLKGAKREGKTVWEIAEFYTKAFQQDMHALQILNPDIWCKATDHIAEQIAMIQLLEKRGFTYAAGGNVYFDTSKLEDYGKLARLNLAELQSGARVDIDKNKRNPTDFVLWFTKSKFEDQEMKWESPYGRGYPGWHIECSAMSVKYLGDQFDIHCGGIDHIAVHHTNEIAQTEAATGKQPWVQLWMHGEFLVIDKGKMAKSGENFIKLQTLVDKGYTPLVYRYFCLTAAYRQQLSFSWESMDTAKNGYDAIRTKILDLHEKKGQGSSAENREHEHKQAFLEAINDDLNMPQALAALWQMLRDDQLANERKILLAEKFDEVFGLGIKDFAQQEVPNDILELARARELARKNKDFATSDKLRDEIKQKGYIIDDKPDNAYTIRRA
jgi:cysteinyl-tRNA synthetase